MGLKLSKCYSFYSFYPIWAKLYEGIEYHHGGIQVITFLANRPSFTNYVALCEIVTWESMAKNITWNIWKRLIVEQNGQKFGTRDPTVHIRRVLLMPHSMYEFGLGSFCALCHISDFTVFEALLLQQFSSNFNQTSYKVSKALWNFNMLVTGKSYNVDYLESGWSSNEFGTPGTTVHTWRLLLMPDFLSLVWGHSEHFAKFIILPFLKLLLSQYSSNSSQLYIRYPNHGSIQAIPFLAICHKWKKLWHFYFFSEHRTTCSWKFRSPFSPTVFIGAYPNVMRTLVIKVNLNAC